MWIQWGKVTFHVETEEQLRILCEAVTNGATMVWIWFMV